MNIDELLAEFSARGVELSVNENNVLHIEGRKLLSADEIELLRSRKDEVVARLAAQRTRAQWLEAGGPDIRFSVNLSRIWWHSDGTMEAQPAAPQRFVLTCDPDRYAALTAQVDAARAEGAAPASIAIALSPLEHAALENAALAAEIQIDPFTGEVVKTPGAGQRIIAMTLAIKAALGGRAFSGGTDEQVDAAIEEDVAKDANPPHPSQPGRTPGIRPAPRAPKASDDVPRPCWSCGQLEGVPHAASCRMRDPYGLRGAFASGIRPSQESNLTEADREQMREIERLLTEDRP